MQETELTPNRINPKKVMPENIIKLPKNKDKEKNLEISQREVTHYPLGNTKLNDNIFLV